MRRKPLLLTLAVLALVALLCGGVYLVGHGITNALHRIEAFGPVAKRLPEELAAAKREGLPLTPSDLRRSPPVPHERNAAPYYVQIARILRARAKPEQDHDGEAEARMLKQARTQIDREATQRLLTKYAPVVRLADRAAAMPDCDFQRPYQQGPTMQFPEYGCMREAVRLLSMRACLQSTDGDVAGAFDTISACARIGRHAGSDQCMIAMLVRIALDTIADMVFQIVLLAHIDSPDAVAKARATLATFGSAPDLATSLRGEVVFGRVVVDDVRKGGGLNALTLPAELLGQGGQTRKMMCDGWEVRFMSYWRRVSEGLRRNRGDLLAQYRAFKQICDDEAANDGKPTYELSTILMPTFSAAPLKVMGDEARRRMRSTLVDLVAYRQAHRAFPERLSDLGTRVPIDPFTNRPLIYRREGAGFVLYGLGENFRDDGGIAKDPKKSDKMLDIVVRYPSQP